jgi:hypothetical protein
MIADSPLQFLARCYEYAEWSHLEEQDRGLEFVSHTVVWGIVQGDDKTRNDAPARYAVEAMQWFKQLVKIANEATDMPLPIRWTTPSGFIVEMDCRIKRDRRPKLSSLSGASYRPTIFNELAQISKGQHHPLSRRKQAT